MDDMQTLRDALSWSAAIHGALPSAWFVAFTGTRDALYPLRGRWFCLSPERFDAIHHAAMGSCKVALLLLGLVPWPALRIAA